MDRKVKRGRNEVETGNPAVSTCLHTESAAERDLVYP